MNISITKPAQVVEIVPNTTVADVGMKIVNNTSTAISKAVCGTGYVALKTIGTITDIGGICTLIAGGATSGSLIYSSFVNYSTKTTWESVKDGVFNAASEGFSLGSVFSSAGSAMSEIFGKSTRNLGASTSFWCGIAIAGVFTPIGYLTCRKISNLTNDFANRLVAKN